MIAINVPIKATVRPVFACETRRTTAIKKITTLLINSFLSVIAEFGSGQDAGSTSAVPRRNKLLSEAEIKVNYNHNK